MGSISDIKKGAVIRYQNDLFVVTSFNFVNPGKGSAFTRTKMKSLTRDKSMEVTFKSSETVDLVDVEYVNMQFLYQKGEILALMDQTSYETVEINASIMGDDAKFLKEGLEVVAAMYEGSVVAIRLPKKITYSVAEAPEGVRGNSAGGNVTKEIVLDNGLRLQAPLFIKPGEQIIVNTETGDYCSRAGEGN